GLHRGHCSFDANDPRRTYRAAIPRLTECEGISQRRPDGLDRLAKALSCCCRNQGRRDVERSALRLHDDEALAAAIVRLPGTSDSLGDETHTYSSCDEIMLKACSLHLGNDADVSFHRRSQRNEKRTVPASIGVENPRAIEQVGECRYPANTERTVGDRNQLIGGNLRNCCPRRPCAAESAYDQRRIKSAVADIAQKTRCPTCRKANTYFRINARHPDDRVRNGIAAPPVQCRVRNAKTQQSLRLRHRVEAFLEGLDFVDESFPACSHFLPIAGKTRRLYGAVKQYA